MRALLSHLTSLCCRFFTYKVDKQGRETVRLGTNIRMQFHVYARCRHSIKGSPLIRAAVGLSHVFWVNVCFHWGIQNHKAPKGQEPIGGPIFFNIKVFFFLMFICFILVFFFFFFCLSQVLDAACRIFTVA